MAKQPIILTDQIIPPPALVRAGLETLPAIIRAQGERAGRRFIEFFTATIRNRNTRMAYARAVKRFFDWCEDHHLGLMGYTFARVSAVVTLRVEDYFQQGRRSWLRLHEKGGERH